MDDGTVKFDLYPDDKDQEYQGPGNKVDQYQAGDGNKEVENV